MVLSPYPVHLNPTGFAPLPCATEVCVLLLLLLVEAASSISSLKRRLRSRRRRSPIQVCNDVVKENQMAMP